MATTILKQTCCAHAAQRPWGYDARAVSLTRHSQRSSILAVQSKSRCGSGNLGFSDPRNCKLMRHIASRRGVVVCALGGDGEKPEKKRFITREEEPDEFWISAAERAGENPFASPLAWIGVLAIFFPFILLGVAFGLGLVKLPNT